MNKYSYGQQGACYPLSRLQDFGVLPVHSMVGALIGIKLYENSVVLEYYIMPAKLIYTQISIF